MDIKIIKKLGEGICGTVYLSEIDNKYAITKIEKHNDDIKTSESPYIRQILFNDMLAKKYPDRFMVLISSSIINDCNHKQHISKNFFKNADVLVKNYYMDKEKQKKCYILNYRPVLKYTLGDLLENDLLTKKGTVKAFKYLKKSVEIINKNGFIHRDLHGYNIMCDEKMTKFYIIDYGYIYHKSFIKSIEDKIMHEHYPDIISLIWIFLENPVYKYMNANNIKNKVRYNDTIKYIKNDNRYNIIKTFIPKNVFKNKYYLIGFILCFCVILFYDLYIESIKMNNTDIGKEYINFKQSNEKLFFNALCKYKYI